MNAIHPMALVNLVAGYTVWSSGCVVLYGLQALGCAYGWSNHRLWLILAYLITLVPLAYLALRPLDSDRGNTLSVAALWANRAALGAGILTFLPVIFVTICD